MPINFSLEFRNQAREELADAVLWYDKINPKLADRLLDEVDKMLDTILHFPNSFPIAYLDTRQALVRSFPYVILYRVKEPVITVYAIFHTSRDPEEWIKRI